MGIHVDGALILTRGKDPKAIVEKLIGVEVSEVSRASDTGKLLEGVSSQNELRALVSDSAILINCHPALLENYHRGLMSLSAESRNDAVQFSLNEQSNRYEFVYYRNGDQDDWTVYLTGEKETEVLGKDRMSINAHKSNLDVVNDVYLPYLRRKTGRDREGLEKCEMITYNVVAPEALAQRGVLDVDGLKKAALKFIQEYNDENQSRGLMTDPRRIPQMKEAIQELSENGLHVPYIPMGFERFKKWDTEKLQEAANLGRAKMKEGYSFNEHFCVGLYLFEIAERQQEVKDEAAKDTAYEEARTARENASADHNTGDDDVHEKSKIVRSSLDDIPKVSPPEAEPFVDKPVKVSPKKFDVDFPIDVSEITGPPKGSAGQSGPSSMPKPGGKSPADILKFAFLIQYYSVVSKLKGPLPDPTVVPEMAKLVTQMKKSGIVVPRVEPGFSDYLKLSTDRLRQETEDMWSRGDAERSFPGYFRHGLMSFELSKRRNDSNSPKSNSPESNRSEIQRIQREARERQNQSGQRSSSPRQSSERQTEQRESSQRPAAQQPRRLPEQSKGGSKVIMGIVLFLVVAFVLSFLVNLGNSSNERPAATQYVSHEDLKMDDIENMLHLEVGTREEYLAGKSEFWVYDESRDAYFIPTRGYKLEFRKGAVNYYVTGQAARKALIQGGFTESARKTKSRMIGSTRFNVIETFQAY